MYPLLPHSYRIFATKYEAINAASLTEVADFSAHLWQPFSDLLLSKYSTFLSSRAESLVLLASYTTHKGFGAFSSFSIAMKQNYISCCCVCSWIYFLSFERPSWFKLWFFFWEVTSCVTSHFPLPLGLVSCSHCFSPVIYQTATSCVFRPLSSLLS